MQVQTVTRSQRPRRGESEMTATGTKTHKTATKSVATAQRSINMKVTAQSNREMLEVPKSPRKPDVRQSLVTQVGQLDESSSHTAARTGRSGRGASTACAGVL